MACEPFDDMPPFTGRTWRHLVRWMLRHGGFRGIPDGMPVASALTLPAQDAHFTRWVRRRPALVSRLNLAEIIRIDVKGHPSKGFTDLQPTVERGGKIFTTRAMGFGELRHFHKVAAPVGCEDAYFSMFGTPAWSHCYDDTGQLTPSNRHDRLHIRIRA